MARFSSRSARFAPLLPALLLAPLLVPMAGVLPARAQGVSGGIADSPRYLRFTNDTASGERLLSPKLTLSIGGVGTSAVMDTGSTGVVVSLAGMFPNWKSDPEIVGAVDALLPAGSNSSYPGPIDTTKLDKSLMKSITYTSSGRIMYGIYLDRAVTVTGATPAGGAARSVTSTKVPVLVVIDEECLPKARSCTPNHAPDKIGMLGIGFARAAPGDQYGTRTLNPFLNLQTPSAVNGYVVTRNGVKVGLDDNDLATRSSTLTVLGTNTSMPGEWLPQQASITVDGRAAVTGNMLLDTGITTMLMTVPSATSDGLRIAPPAPVDPAAKPSTDSTLPDGTRIGIALADASGLPVGYGFTVGKTGGMAPKSVTLVANNGSKPDWKATYVNTGVRMLNGFDMIFDDTHGLLGFAARVQDGS